MNESKGKGEMEKVKGRLSRRRAFPLVLVPLTLSLLHFPVSSAFAQQLDQSELPQPLTSRQVEPRFMNLDLESGLSQANVNDMLQDRQGFMWFTTQDGLNRWDGYEMTVFKHQPFDSTSLSSSDLEGMAEDEHGAIWVTTQSGLNRMDPVTEKFKSFRHDPDNPSSIGNDRTHDVVIASDGTIWVSHNDGVDWMDPARPGEFHHYRHEEDDPASLSGVPAYELFEDSAGRIWVGTNHGLNRLDDREAGRFTHFLDEPDQSGCHGPNTRPELNEIGWILERPEEPGILWITNEDRLIRLDTGNDGMKAFRRPPTRPCNPMMQLTQDPLNPGVLWIANGQAGLTRFDIRTGRFNLFSPGSGSEKDGLLKGFTYSAFTDRSGIVWTGVWLGGLSRFDPSSVGLRHYEYNRDDRNTIRGQAVTSVFQSRDGHVWVTTWGPETSFVLTELDRDADRATHYRHDPNDPSSMSDGQVWGAVEEDAAGFIWVGTEAGLDRLDRSTGHFRHFRHDPADGASFRGGRVTRLFIDASGTLWIGQVGALSSTDALNPGSFKTYGSLPDDPDGFTPGLVAGISEDRSGALWVATRAGVNRFDPISETVRRFIHEEDNPHSLSSSGATYAAERRREPGIIWVTTYGAGLNRLDAQTGVAKYYTEKDGLANNGVYGFVEDDQGRLWMPTNRGISRFDPETETFRNYGLEVGLQSLEFNSGGFFKGPFGEFFFAGTNGMNSFFPNELDENSTPPQVTLVDLKLFNESVKKTGAVQLSSVLNETDEVVLNYDQRDVSFDFVAFHFANPGSNQYAYKLDGWNDDWVYIGSKRTASFTNLDPGEYTFHVKAANSDGVWNEEGTSIRLKITPPFWATWWFRLLGFLAFAGVIYGGFRLRTSQLEARARHLEGEVDKRTAQLKESNDQLEQSHSIVEAINRETSFTRVLTKILEEARVIPGVEKATAVVYMPFEDRFVIRASSGWDVEAMRDIRLTRSEARDRYVEQAEEVAEDVFVAKGVTTRAGAGQMAEFGKVASFLVLRVRVEDDVVAYLVFDNLTDENAFDQRDAELLERLREHITSAFIKSRILEDLQSERTNLQSALDELRSTQDRLVQSEKMASLGQLTAGIAHEIKNPLNFVNNFSDVTAELSEELAAEISALKESLPADRMADLESIIENLTMNARKIKEHGRRADGIVQNMLEHSKAGDGTRTPTDLNDLLEEYVVLAHHALRSRDDDFDVHIERNFDDSIGKVDMVPQEMGRVFMNLIGNAFDALRENAEGRGESGEVAAPTVTVSTSKNGSQVEIRIADNGPGIPPEVKSKIFEPFFTTKPTGSGTGLGLSMSYDIVTKGHGGELDVESTVGKGATFIVRLPA